MRKSLYLFALLFLPFLAKADTCPSAANYYDNTDSGAKTTLAALGITNCFYIAASGSDGNPGTKASPWQHLPGMAGSTTGHTPVAGEGFILKGGDTWVTPGVAWAWGGTSTNPIYIGVDSTFFSGSSWARPIWTCNNTGCNLFTSQTNRAYNIIDNIEATGLHVVPGNEPNYFQVCGTNDIVENIYAHGWSHNEGPYNITSITEDPTGTFFTVVTAVPQNFVTGNTFSVEIENTSNGIFNGTFAIASITNSTTFVINAARAANATSTGGHVGRTPASQVFGTGCGQPFQGFTARYNVADGSDTSQQFGYFFLSGAPIAYGNIARYVLTGLDGCGDNWHDNLVENMVQGVVTSHQDAIFHKAGCYSPHPLIYNNVVRHHTLPGFGGAVKLWIQGNGPCGTLPIDGCIGYVFNNVVYDNIPGNMINTGDHEAENFGTWYIFNNTFNCGTDTSTGGCSVGDAGNTGGPSSTTNTIGTGSKTFTVQTNMPFLCFNAAPTCVASFIAHPTGNPNIWMAGTVTSYSGTTLTANITATQGSGTFSSWAIGGQMALHFINNHWISTDTNSIKGRNGQFGSCDHFTCDETHGLYQTVAQASANSSPNFDQYSGSQTFGDSPVASTNSTVKIGADETALCATISSISATAGTACNNGTSYAITYNMSNHSVVFPARAPVARGATRDIGAYQFSGGTQGPAPAPSCDHASGTYPGAQSVSCSDAGAPVICYTTNGANPATNGVNGCTTGTLYTAPINIPNTLTLKVVAGGSGFSSDSSVVSYTYIILFNAANPSCLPPSGTYALPLNIACSDSSAGAIICYTLNGATPATNGGNGCTTGSLYSSVIPIPASLTLQVIAGGTGYLDSSVISYSYIVNSPPPGPVAAVPAIFARK